MAHSAVLSDLWSLPEKTKLHLRKRIAKTSQKLDYFKNMIADLQQAKPNSQTEGQKRLASKITADFEGYMNNDLDVKAAFDSLYETVSELHEKRAVAKCRKT